MPEARTADEEKQRRCSCLDLVRFLVLPVPGEAETFWKKKKKANERQRSVWMCFEVRSPGDRTWNDPRLKSRLATVGTDLLYAAPTRGLFFFFRARLRRVWESLPPENHVKISARNDTSGPPPGFFAETRVFLSA